MSEPGTTVLAVDFGGTKTALARVDEHGTLGERRTLPAAHALEASVAQAADAAHGVSAIGVIVPGIYSPATGRAWCPNLWGADEVPLRRALEGRVDAELFIDSDRAGCVRCSYW